jgi:hypothetical protein
MLRTGTLLIVMVLAGMPASAVACELWCTHPGGAVPQHEAECHDDRTSQDGWKPSAVVSCHVDLTIAPFLTEAKQTPSKPSIQPLGTIASCAPTLVAAPATTTRWGGLPGSASGPIRAVHRPSYLIPPQASL